MSAGDLRLGLVIGARADGTVKRSFNAVDREVDQTRKNLKTLGVQREATQSVVALRKQLLTLQRASRRAGDGNEGLQRKIKSVAGELERAERKASNYGVDISNVARETHRLASETKAAERSLESFSRRQGVVQSRADQQATRARQAQVGRNREGIAGLAPDQRLQQLGAAEQSARGVVRYRTELLRLNRAQRKAGGSNQDLARRIDHVGRELRQAENAAERYGVDVGNITRETRRLGRETRQTTREIDRLGREQRQQERRQRGTENRRQMGQVATGAAVVAGTAAAVHGGRSAMAYRREGVRLKTAVTADDLEAAIEQSRQEALSFALDTGLDATGLLRIEYALNSAGFEAAAARAGGRVVAQVARVTNGADERVAEVVASVYNNLGEQFDGNVQERLARVGDLLTKTQLKFQFRNFDQLGESLAEALPATISNNIALEETLTLLGLLNGAGLRGSRAGTAFTATLRQMSKAAGEFGFELVRSEDGALDVVATLRNLDEAIGGIDNIDQATRDSLQKEFGEEGIRMVNLLLPKLDEIPAALKDVDKNAKGIFNRKDKLFVDDPSGEIDRMQKNFGYLSQTIIDAWLPTAGDAADQVADLIQGLVEFSRERPNTVMAITGVAGALTGAKLAAAAWYFATGRQGKALTTLALGPIPQMIGALGRLKGAKMKTAAKSFLGSPITKAKWTVWLGRAGAVGAAGALGYAIGSAINAAIDDTPIGDAIGESIARVLAAMGNDEAQAALEANGDAGKAAPPVDMSGLEGLGGTVPEYESRSDKSSDTTRKPTVPDRPIIYRDSSPAVSGRVPVYDPTRRDDEAQPPMRDAASFAPAGLLLPEVRERVERDTYREREVSGPASFNFNGSLNVYPAPGADVDQLARDLAPAMDKAAREAIEQREARANRRRRTALHE